MLILLLGLCAKKIDKGVAFLGHSWGKLACITGVISQGVYFRLDGDLLLIS